MFKINFLSIEIILFIVLFLFFSIYKQRLISFKLLKNIVAFANKKGLVVAFIIMYIMLFNVILFVIEKPSAKMIDELSYVFQAKTFLEGRLVNPTPPQWEHFQTFFIVPKPYFVSKFPPGQALFMALGGLISGEFVVGIWIIFILACVATYWMLLAYVKPHWAFLGVFAVASNGHLLLEWSNTYWGGALPMLGGALVFGAIKRIVDTNSKPLLNGILLALGVAILAYSRPFEGLIASISIIFPVFFGKVFSKYSFKFLLVKTIFPALIIIILALGFLFHYNKSITGSYSSLPYNLYHSRYETARSFLFQKPHETPEGIPYQMEKFHNNEKKRYFNRRSSIPGFLKGVADKLFMFGRYYVRVVYLIPFLFFLFSPKHIWQKYSLGVLLVLLLSNFITTWNETYYIAPITVLFIYMIISGFRSLSFRRWKYYRTTVNTIIVLILLHPFIGVAAHIKRDKSDFTSIKTNHITKLNANDKKDLIIVHYEPEHKSNNDFVYNEPDIENADVIWARDLGENKNNELIDYFKERNIWYFFPDEDPDTLVKYEDLANKI